MVYLLLGILLWIVVHALPSVGLDVKKQLVARIGVMPYRGLFSVVVILSIVLMVYGWKQTSPQLLYVLPEVVMPIAKSLIYVAFVLLVATGFATRLKRVFRHPQLTGVLFWSIGHLLMNGDNRSVVLFGFMALWALVEMLLINRREGVWIKGEVPVVSKEVIIVAIGTVLYVGVMFLHPYVSGVAIL